ncbi:MAG: WXG100 family type VII secretion target [Humibacillus sp.]|nr:WXG100 family type VII secretion target [Humibacillus sp.]MDN5776450.1 WXG100 family type VII secretion target [Humibacillus sp.]
MRYQVDPAVLLSEAADVGGAARTLAGMRVVEQLGTLREAIPGGSSAAAVSGIQASWRTELTDVRAHVRALGDALGSASAAYERVETAAERMLGGAR